MDLFVLADVEGLQSKWKWFLLLGLALICLGVLSLAFIPAATWGTVLAPGWIIIVAGVLEVIQVIRVHKWNGLYLHLIGGILGVLIGLLIITHPLAGALAWTLLFSAMFTVFGTFRVAGAIMLKSPHWGWTVFHGSLSILCGILLSWTGHGRGSGSSAWP
jgi:uncharacterized membrane protein HdeD (DUF308 family)